VSGKAAGTYYYRVEAMDGPLTSAFSNTQSTTVSSPTLPAPVLNAISNPSGASSYSVSWTSVPSATQYTLQEATTSSFSNPQTLFAGAATSFQVSGKAAGTYYYRVEAIDGPLTSAFSNTQSTTVSSPSNLPGTPTLTSIAQGASPNNYTVFWGGVANATSYTLQQSTNSAFTGPYVVAQGNVLCQCFYNQPNGTYYYRVSATNANGTSSFSNVLSITIPFP
jgi:hypothetical protein